MGPGSSVGFFWNITQILRFQGVAELIFFINPWVFFLIHPFSPSGFDAYLLEDWFGFLARERTNWLILALAFLKVNLYFIWIQISFLRKKYSCFHAINVKNDLMCWPFVSIFTKVTVLLLPGTWKAVCKGKKEDWIGWNSFCLPWFG